MHIIISSVTKARRTKARGSKRTDKILLYFAYYVQKILTFSVLGASKTWAYTYNMPIHIFVRINMHVYLYIFEYNGVYVRVYACK